MSASFRIVKISDDGSSSEFNARLMFGILRLREDAVRGMCPAPEADFLRKRHAFDDVYDPVLSAMRATRGAATELTQVISSHIERLDGGKIVLFQPRAFQITEGIDVKLQELAGRVLMRGVIALKGVQSVTAFFGLDIGPFFQKASNFEAGMLGLRKAGHAAFEAYLRTARTTWTERFIEQRADIEHNGWVLPAMDYFQVGPTTVCARIPTVFDLPVHDFARLSARRLQAFVENTVVYAITRQMPEPMILIEIPRSERRPELPERFDYGLRDRGMPEWFPVYDDNDFLE